MGSRRWSIYPSWASGALAPCGKTAGLPLGLGPCCHAAGHLKFPAQENRRISLATGLYIESRTAASPPNLGILTIFEDLHVSQRPTSSKSPRETPFPTSPRPVSPLPHPRRALRRVWRNPNAPGTAPTSPPRPPPTRPAQSRRTLRSPHAPVAAPDARVADGNSSSHPLKHLSRGMGRLSVIMKRHDTKDRMKP